MLKYARSRTSSEYRPTVHTCILFQQTLPRRGFRLRCDPLKKSRATALPRAFYTVTKKQEAGPDRFPLSLEGRPFSPVSTPPEAFHSPRHASPKSSPQNFHGVGTTHAAAWGRPRVCQEAGRSPSSFASSQRSAACGGWDRAVEGGGASGAELGAHEGLEFRAVETFRSPSSGRWWWW